MENIQPSNKQINNQFITNLVNIKTNNELSLRNVPPYSNEQIQAITSTFIKSITHVLQPNRTVHLKIINE